MRNKTVFASAALTALMAGGVAHAQSGHVGISYQNAEFGSGDVDNTALSGAVLLGSHVQLNGRYANIDTAGPADIDYWSIDGFVFSRSGGGAFGGYAGYDTFDVSASIDEWSIGGFGQLYAGNTTWTGKIGYADTEGDIEVIHLDGEVRHFVNDNFSIQGNLGFGGIEFSGGGEDDYWSGGLGAEWQFLGAPFSIYGGWQHVDFDSGDADRLGIGARWNFGGGSLLDRNRSGASFERITPTLFELEVGGGIAPR